MGVIQQLWRATMAATKAFREEYTATNPLLMNEEFSTFDGRKLRYAINWAMYEQTAYRRVHRWSESYKTTFGLYRYIRNIYNPAARLADFWQSHLWGGALDMEAGDGKQKPSALPIMTEIESMRPAIGKVWEWSNWHSEKDIVTLRGAVLGDSFVKIVDDPERKKVYMTGIHPGVIKNIEVDHWGNVKAYTLEESRPDPRNRTPVLYREEATREGDDVIYRTFLNGSPFAWDGDVAEWRVPYGFIPMVFIRHRNVGMTWGWSEMHAGLSNFREVDDQASLLNDQIRKMVNSPWFFSGVNGSSSVTVTGNTPTTNNPEAGREETPALYGPTGSSAQALVAPLDITATAANIEAMLKKIERDYPELSDNLQNSSGDVSGRALRINRQPVIDRVGQRRPNYDDGLVRAHQMALAIGGWRGYDEAFSGFDLDSFGAGKLAHSIGTRDVFAKDPMDDIEIQTAFWTAANQAKAAGLPLKFFLKRNGWSNEDIAEFENSPESQARIGAMQASVKASQAMNGQNMRPTLQAKTEGSNNGNL